MNTNHFNSPSRGHNNIAQNTSYNTPSKNIYISKQGSFTSNNPVANATISDSVNKDAVFQVRRKQNSIFLPSSRPKPKFGANSSLGLQQEKKTVPVVRLPPSNREAPTVVHSKSEGFFVQGPYASNQATSIKYSQKTDEKPEKIENKSHKGNETTQNLYYSRHTPENVGQKRENTNNNGKPGFESNSPHRASQSFFAELNRNSNPSYHFKPSVKKIPTPLPSSPSRPHWYASYPRKSQYIDHKEICTIEQENGNAHEKLKEFIEIAASQNEAEAEGDNDDSLDGGWVSGMNVRLLNHQIKGFKFLLGREAIDKNEHVNKENALNNNETNKESKIQNFQGKRAANNNNNNNNNNNEKEDMLNKRKGSRLGGILADDMGLGKTIQMLALIVENKCPENDQYAQGTLVIAPLALVRQWEAEIKDKAPDLRVYVHHGPNRKTDPSYYLSFDVVITTYQIAVSEWNGSTKIEEKPTTKIVPNKKGVFGVNWWRIVLDEAQSIKNRSSKSAQACYALSGKYRWCLSGTPLQNSVDELYSLIRFLQIEPLSDYGVWKDKITNPIQNGKAKIAIDRLQVVLPVIMLRRTKKVLESVGLKLPHRIVMDVSCSFDENERKFYQELSNRATATFNQISKVEGGIGKNYTSVLVLLLRLRQACDHPCLIDKSLLEDHDAIKLTKDIVDAGKKSSAVSNDEIDDIADSLFGLKFNKPTERKCSICMSPLLSKSENSRCDACSAIVATTQSFSISGSKINLRKSAKIERMLKILGDNDFSHYEKDLSINPDPNAKTIIFSQFTSMLDTVEPFLKDAGYSFVRCK